MLNLDLSVSCLQNWAWYDWHFKSIMLTRWVSKHRAQTWSSLMMEWHLEFVRARGQDGVRMSAVVWMWNVTNTIMCLTYWSPDGGVVWGSLEMRPWEGTWKYVRQFNFLALCFTVNKQKAVPAHHLTMTLPRLPQHGRPYHLKLWGKIDPSSHP